MFHNDSIRRTAALVLSGTLLALSFGPAAQVANAQCADPRGNSYCTNGGLVNTQNPNPSTNVNVQNPDAGNSNVQNPNAPIAIAGGSQINVLNGGGVPGGGVVVTGQGFGKNNNMYINITDSSGAELDTDSRAFSCTETDN